MWWSRLELLTLVSNNFDCRKMFVQIEWKHRIFVSFKFSDKRVAFSSSCFVAFKYISYHCQDLSTLSIMHASALASLIVRNRDANCSFTAVHTIRLLSLTIIRRIFTLIQIPIIINTIVITSYGWIMSLSEFIHNFTYLVCRFAYLLQYNHYKVRTTFAKFRLIG